MIFTMQQGPALRGTVRCPGDKSISHRYAMLAALARGESELVNFAVSQDCRSTLRCLRELGVETRQEGDSVFVAGNGLDGLRAPALPLDAGNSGTTMRLLSGILAGQPFDSVLAGDESLSRRPMNRILHPLRLMGTRVGCREGGLPPLAIRGGDLKAIRYSLPVASAQVKSCILFAGMFADGVTAVEERVATRDHSEIALRQFGAVVWNSENWIEIEPRPALAARRLEVPGDLSGAAFFIVAAALVPGSEIRIPGVGVNPRRRALVDYLRAAGVNIEVEHPIELAGEARADLRITHGAEALAAGLPPIEGDWAAALIDEIPVLAVLGSQAGGLVVRDARELRVKESDRISAMAANLRAMGARVEELSDGMILAGGQRLHGAEIDTQGDHRIAMSFTVAGLAASGQTRIHRAECADISYPGFYDQLNRLRAGGTAR
jgi:3-phosphoshikimate 1-carboxyvinyltransferase